MDEPGLDFSGFSPQFDTFATGSPGWRSKSAGIMIFPKKIFSKIEIFVKSGPSILVGIAECTVRMMIEAPHDL